MSDNILHFIPTEPGLIPSDTGQLDALAALKRLVPDADTVTKWTSPLMQFVNQGAKLEGISCPICEAPIDFMWWQQTMDSAYRDGGFGSLDIQTPCCNGPSTLNDLTYYHYPAGFARFGLEARNPRIDEKRAQSICLELEKALNCPLKIIWDHY